MCVYVCVYVCEQRFNRQTVTIITPCRKSNVKRRKYYDVIIMKDQQEQCNINIKSLRELVTVLLIITRYTMYRSRL